MANTRQNKEKKGIKSPKVILNLSRQDKSVEGSELVRFTLEIEGKVRAESKE